MNRSPRVNYDAIAHLYDSQPYRTKIVDPELLAFVAERAATDVLSLLDIGCGTGNQLVANRGAITGARLVGVDRSRGMLRQARPKAADILWVQAEATALPLPAGSFDFVSCQYAFHHFREKADMLREVFRVLRPGGRVVLRNLFPQESADWLYYDYFPAAQIADLKDFWPVEAIIAVMEGVGLARVTTAYEHLRYEQDLRELIETARRRDTCSQLQAIPDAAYVAGLRRLERELADPAAPKRRADHLCMVNIRGEKRKLSSDRGSACV
jgi:ubiquinone/menaquinone biosynthesis C-methylase UbiE